MTHTAPTPPIAPTPPTARSRQLAIYSLTAAYFAMGTGLMAVIGLLEPMSRQWQVEQSDIALLLTIFSATFAIAAPAIQVIFSGYAQRTLLLCGLCLMAIGSIGIATAGTYETGIAMRIVMALGAAAIGPVATAIATALSEPNQQMKTLAILFSGMTLSSVIGVPIAAWLGQNFSWQIVFFLVALLCLACAGVLRHTVTLRQPGLRLSFRDFTEVFKRADTRWAVSTTWLHMSGQFICYALIALLFVQIYDFKSEWLSPALFGMGVGHLVGNILTGVFGDRFKAESVIRFSLIGMIIVFFLLWLTPKSPAVVAALFFCWSVIGSLFQPPQQKRLIALNPRIRPLLLAMNASALYLGIAGGSAMATLIQSNWGLASLPLVAAAVTAAALGAIQLSTKAARRLTNPQT
ncbi:MAG: MFS transporter [Burkholderiaceae bacterium]